MGIHSHASGGNGITTLPTGSESVSVPLFRDWIAHVPPQLANSWWSPAMSAFPNAAPLSEAKGIRSGITDVNHTTWAQASAAGNTMCFNRGFFTGYLDGYQDGWDWGDDSKRFGVLCSGPGVTWRDVESPEIASTTFPFTNVANVHRAQANRAADVLMVIRRMTSMVWCFIRKTWRNGSMPRLRRLHASVMNSET